MLLLQPLLGDNWTTGLCIGKLSFSSSLFLPPTTGLRNYIARTWSFCGSGSSRIEEGHGGPLKQSWQCSWVWSRWLRGWWACWAPAAAKYQRQVVDGLPDVQDGTEAAEKNSFRFKVILAQKRKGATWRRSKLQQLRDWIIWADAQTGTITCCSIDVLTRIVLCLSKMAVPTLAISVSHNRSNHCEMVKKMRPSYEPKCTFFFEKWRFKINSQYIYPNQMF